jgi:hypothetical protein
MWPGYVRRVTSLTAAGGQEREPCLDFRNGECVSTRRWSFSGPLLTGKVGNESLLGVRAEEYVVKRANSCQIIGEQPSSIPSGCVSCFQDLLEKKLFSLFILGGAAQIIFPT